MLDDTELKTALDRAPHERVTLGQMESRIARTDFLRIGETVTVCNLVLDNGFSVRGESACVDPRNYNQAIGEKLSRDQAISKLWPLFGFLLAEFRHIKAKS